MKNAKIISLEKHKHKKLVLSEFDKLQRAEVRQQAAKRTEVERAAKKKL